ncbi:hypothetical protein BH20ACT21_BH20ACT21_06990 [soil metagenome]
MVALGAVDPRDPGLNVSWIGPHNVFEEAGKVVRPDVACIDAEATAHEVSRSIIDVGFIVIRRWDYAEHGVVAATT